MKPDRMSTIEACIDDIRSAYDDLEMVKDEEQDAFDNMPEGLQESERGDMMQEAIDTLDDVLMTLNDALSTLDEVTSPVDEDLIMEKDPWDDLEEGDAVIQKAGAKVSLPALTGNTVLPNSPRKRPVSASRTHLKEVFYRLRSSRHE